MSYKIVGIGELLWDLLPGGKRLGGAPANFAFHAQSLGAEGIVVSRVGDDPLGHEILRQLTHLGLRTDLVQVDPRAPTGTVSVELSATGQPTYTIHEGAAWDHLEGTRAHPIIGKIDAVCFGTLAQRNGKSGGTIRSFVKSSSARLRILDLNLRQQYFSHSLIEESLRLANALKLNDEELMFLSNQFSLRGTEDELVSQLADQFDLEVVALTRGGKGSLLFSKGQMDRHPGFPTTIADTIGAGDSFTATLAMGLLSGWALPRINEAANRVAALVCSQSGATPELPPALKNLFRPPSPSDT